MTYNMLGFQEKKNLAYGQGGGQNRKIHHYCHQSQKSGLPRSLKYFYHDKKQPKRHESRTRTLIRYSFSVIGLNTIYPRNTEAQQIQKMFMYTNVKDY